MRRVKEMVYISCVEQNDELSFSGQRKIRCFHVHVEREGSARQSIRFQTEVSLASGRRRRRRRKTRDRKI